MADTKQVGKWTAAPWKAMFDLDGDHAIFAGDKLIATTTGRPEIPMDEDQANAHVMAQAPALATALAELLERFNAVRYVMQRFSPGDVADGDSNLIAAAEQVLRDAGVKP